MTTKTKSLVNKAHLNMAFVNKIMVSIIFSLFLSACGGGSNSPDVAATLTTPDQTDTITPTPVQNPAQVPNPIVEPSDTEQQPEQQSEEPADEPDIVSEATISSVGPSCAKPGALVTVTGQNLSVIFAVSVAEEPATITSLSAESIEFRIPEVIAEGFTSITLSSKEGKAISTLFSVGCPSTVAIKEIVAAKVLQIVPKTGDTVTATNPSDGVTFALEIPSGALTADTQIGLTPLSQIAGVPLSKGILFGAKFEPDGLQFPTPVSFRVTLPTPPPEDLIGFQFSGPDNKWTLFPVEVDGNTLVFSISHFSGAGAGVISRDDFITAVQPIISSIGILPVSQVSELAGIFDAFIDRFPDLCDSGEGAKTCLALKDIAQNSVNTRLAALCPEDLEGPLPSVLETTADEVLGLSASAQLLTIDSGKSIDCAEEIYSRILKEEISRLNSLPTLERFARVSDLLPKFQTFGFVELEQSANNALLEAMKILLKLAEDLCPNDFATALGFAAVGEEVFDNDIVLSAELRERLNRLYPHCGVGVVVTPNPVSITPGSSITFLATVLKLASTDVLWSILPNDGANSISQTGEFVAGVKGGTYIITAQSLVAPSVEGTAVVTVEDILSVGVSPSTDVELKAGETQQFFANIDKIGSISSAVTWTATGGIVTEEGLFTAGAVVGENFEVRATSKARPAKFDTTKVRIKSLTLPFKVTTSCTLFRHPTIPNFIVEIDGGALASGGKLPYTVTGVSVVTAPQAVDLRQGSTFFAGSARSLAAGTYTIEGTISDADGATVTRQISVVVSATGQVSGASGCDSQSSVVDPGGSSG